ncbi:MAG: prephenate dehydrogenase/arogenate dehydrogenase family protein [Chloroflexaceae bacterium]|nr:prephenate dehydrogenase/arogenate dehydrogenase family protein [Chloroflexaceae bacterium]
MITMSILGLGLIGTSMGLALKQPQVQTSPFHKVHITGYDYQQMATKMARARKAIDREARTLEEAVADAQLVIVATPVRQVQTLFAQLAPILPVESVITDTSSTKTSVCDWAKTLLPDSSRFIGGHPMAGKEQSGAEAAEADLFQGAIYCLTPSNHAQQTALNTVEALVRALGSTPYYIDPHEHDAFVAGISHLPFLLSTVLVEATSQSPAWNEMANLAASGFRDISRLASGDVAMHRDICLTNAPSLNRWINDAIGILIDIRDHIEQGDEAYLNTLFLHAQQVRDAWLNRPEIHYPGQQTGSHPGRTAARRLRRRPTDPDQDSS